jgi:hypothetical protein
MTADELVAALESKTGEDLVVELAARVFQPPLSELRRPQLPGPPPQVPAALRVPMMVIIFYTETTMGGVGSFLDISTGRDLDDAIEALETIGAGSTAGALAKIRAILVRYGIDLDDPAGIHWDDDEDCATEIMAEKDILTHADREGVYGMLLHRYVEHNRDALLQAIRACVGLGPA